MMRRPTLGAWLVIASTSCAAETRDEGEGSGIVTAGTGASVDTGSTAATADTGPEKLDVGADGTGSTVGDGPGCDASDLAEADATITGTVYAPNGEIPISGALVYTAPTEGLVLSRPEDGVYCDECVELPCHHYTFTAPDGTFSLDAASGDDQRLVVQKGQFMRISALDLAAGEALAVDAAATTLPGRWDPDAGEYIPRIAIAIGEYDTVQDVLAKLGLADVTPAGELAAGADARSFDLFARDAQWETRYGGIAAEGLDLLHDPARLAEYHILFVPCGAELQLESALGLGELEPAVIENLRDWVAKGGKLYVTDDANEYLYRPFAQYQDFFEIDGSPDIDVYDSLGTVQEDGLLAWLEALPDPLKDIGGGQPTLFELPEVLVQGAWSAIQAVHAVEVEDEEGMIVDVGHTVWVDGPQGGGVPAGSEGPLTVTGDYGCGKIMFSSYHTGDDTHAGLVPQELILLYLILEIGVCAQDPAPPPPVG